MNLFLKMNSFVCKTKIDKNSKFLNKFSEKSERKIRRICFRKIDKDSDSVFSDCFLAGILEECFQFRNKLIGSSLCVYGMVCIDRLIDIHHTRHIRFFLLYQFIIRSTTKEIRTVKIQSSKMCC